MGREEACIGWAWRSRRTRAVLMALRCLLLDPQTKCEGAHDDPTDRAVAADCQIGIESLRERTPIIYPSRPQSPPCLVLMSAQRFCFDSSCRC
jgi:hypothetical protein